MINITASAHGQVSGFSKESMFADDQRPLLQRPDRPFNLLIGLTQARGGSALADEKRLPNSEEAGEHRSAANGAAVDPFDPAALRLHTGSAAIVSRRAITTIPVRKPGRQEFVRVHADAGWRLETMVLEIKAERETYLVAPELRAELATECVAKVLYTTIGRDGGLKLWPVKLPGANGNLDEWNRSAHEAALLAQSNWVRVNSNMSLGIYEPWVAEAELGEPEWPPLSFKNVLELAFRDRLIESLDHPVLRRLRGEL